MISLSGLAADDIMERGGGRVGSEHEGGIMLDVGGVAGVFMFDDCVSLSVFP